MGTHQTHNFSYRLFLNKPDGFAHGLRDSTIGCSLNRQFLEVHDSLDKVGFFLFETILDPFCGCATTIEAAHKLGRQWIGIDIAIYAIKRVAAVRLQERLGLVEGKDLHY